MKALATPDQFFTTPGSPSRIVSFVPARSIRTNVMCAGILAALFAARPLAGRQPNQDQATEKAPRASARNSGSKKSYEPSNNYEARQIEGWTVFVNKAFLAKQSKLAKATLTLLREQFRQIVRVVPPGAVEKLRTIQFWVEENEPHHPCMTYHPDAAWLRQNDMNPEKARCVEISNARNFLKWTEQQPWMVLHELSHGYHHQFLKKGFDNPQVKKAYDNAMKAKRYESVLRANGKKEKAYAATNPMEYFAEASESYFGTNDFYPFDRSALERHDPEMCALVDKLWHKD
jgi:hypothetical protein